MGLRKSVSKLKKYNVPSLIKEANSDTPWTYSAMPADRPPAPDERNNSNSLAYDSTNDPNPTIAAFSPNQQTASRNRTKSSVIIHQKSALLSSTPPQVTRALAYSHPFIVPLNYIIGLITWTSGDAWESFLLLASFWFFTLYIDDVLAYAGPVVMVAALIGGMYSRRFSPLSSDIWADDKGKRARSNSGSEQRKSLDEILDTLQIFTTRCDVLMDPLLRMTEFLSTQTTATSASTRPALTAMFIRLLAITPFWYLLTLPPLYIITTRRIILVLGTVGLTWHSRPARATRSILWRSRTVRIIFMLITGLKLKKGPYSDQKRTALPLPPRAPKALTKALSSTGEKAGVKFTFDIYENQRRWVALGFTANLLPNDREGWTDELNHSVPEKDLFPLPETDSDTMRWRWAPGSEWKVDMSWSDEAKLSKTKDKEGWTYYDNKWSNGSRKDDWTKWTRRRRWIRDAELVELTAEEIEAEAAQMENIPASVSGGESTGGTIRRKGWFKRRLTDADRSKTSDKVDVVSVSGSGASKSSRDGPEEDVHTPLRYRETQWDRSIGDGIAEGLS